MVNALNIPSFSCIREGFNEKAKIVGGYMATKEISAKAAVDLSVRLLNKEKTGMHQNKGSEQRICAGLDLFFLNMQGICTMSPKCPASLIIRFMPITKRSFIYWGHCLS